MFETPVGSFIVPLIFISFSFVLVSLIMFLKTNYLLRYPTPFQFFFIFLLIYNILGWPFVLKGMSHLGQIDYDDSFYPIAFFYIHFCMLSIVVGALCANLLTGTKKSHIALFYLKPLTKKKCNAYRLFFIFSLSILVWWSLKNLNGIFNLFSPNYYTIRQAIAQKNSYIAYIISKVIIPLSTTYAFGYVVIHFKKFKYFFAFLIILLGILGSSSTFQKSPFVLLLLMIILLVYLLHNKTVKLRHYFIAIIISMSISIAITWFSDSNIDIKTLITAYIDRLMLVGNFLNYEALYLSHNVDHLFFGGTSFPFLFRGSDLYNYLGGRLWIELFPNMYAAGIVGTANTFFVTALYWDFGFLGGIIGSFLFGLFLQLVQILFLRSSKDLFNLSVFVSLTVFALKFNLTHLGTALLSEGFGIILLISISFKIITSIGKQAYYPNIREFQYVWNLRRSYR